MSSRDSFNAPKLSPKAKLAGYSVLSGAFLFGGQAGANIIYTDVDPDEVVMNGNFNIDMDGDGTADFRINQFGYSSSFYSFAFASDRVGIYDPALFGGSNRVMNVAFAPFQADALSYGASIGPLAGFAASSYNLIGSFFAFSDPYFSTSNLYGVWAGLTDRYLGVRFRIGADTHYGWIRMDVDPAYNMARIKDWAYEDEPGVAILAGDTKQGADEATGLAASDVDDTSSGLDLQLSFMAAADEATVSEYRVFAVPADSLDVFDKAKAESLPASRYLSILPDGSDHTELFGAGMVDSEGDPIVGGVEYTCFVLSMADGTLAEKNTLSDPSNTVTLLAGVDAALSVNAFDAGDTGTGQDLAVQFSPAVSETFIGEYRVIVVDSAEAPIFTLADAEAVPGGNYSAFPPTGSDISVLLNSMSTTADGTPIQNDTPYRVFILSVPDGVGAQIGALSPPSNFITLRTNPVSGLNDPLAQSLQVWASSAVLTLNSQIPAAEVQLVNLHGQVIGQWQYGGGLQEFEVPEGYAQGVHILTLRYENGVASQKLYLSR